jgi:hypothetical protein
MSPCIEKPNQKKMQKGTASGGPASARPALGEWIIVFIFRSGRNREEWRIMIQFPKYP